MKELYWRKRRQKVKKWYIIIQYTIRTNQRCNRISNLIKNKGINTTACLIIDCLAHYIFSALITYNFSQLAGWQVQRFATHFGCRSTHLAISGCAPIRHCMGVTLSASIPGSRPCISRVQQQDRRKREAQSCDIPLTNYHFFVLNLYVS